MVFILAWQNTPYQSLHSWGNYYFKKGFMHHLNRQFAQNSKYEAKNFLIKIIKKLKKKKKLTSFALCPFRLLAFLTQFLGRLFWQTFPQGKTEKRFPFFPPRAFGKKTKKINFTLFQGRNNYFKPWGIIPNSFSRETSKKIKRKKILGSLIKLRPYATEGFPFPN